MTLKGALRLLLSSLLLLSVILVCVELYSFVHKYNDVGYVTQQRHKFRRDREEKTRLHRINRIEQRLEVGRSSTLAWNPDIWRVVKRFKFSHNVLPVGVPSLAILIASAPENLRQRKAIRAAWSREQNGSHILALSFFLIGKTEDPIRDKIVMDEVNDEGDILLGDYKDSYRNLTLKTVHGLNWAGTNLKPFYVLKTDDDCFVNTEVLNNVLTAAIAFQPNVPLSSTRQILSAVTQEATSEKEVDGSMRPAPVKSSSVFSELEEYPSPLYVGSMRWENVVVRDPQSRWFVSKQDYSPSRYPPYTSGAGYILDASALRLFIRTARYVRPFANEDAYVGTVMHEAGVMPRQSSRFSARSSRFWTCNLLYLVVIHGVLPEEQAGLVKRVQDAKQECRGLEVELGWN